MPVISHQNVKLSPGRHRSPADGMCAMELASVLAGERFSDHPRSVCPVIAAVVRTYNDVTDDDGRRALIPYAAMAVGTRAGADVRRDRAERCRAWATQIAERTPRWRLYRRRIARRPPPFHGTGAGCGAWAVRSLGARAKEHQAEVLALLDELIALGAPAPGAVPARLPAPASAARPGLPR